MTIEPCLRRARDGTGRVHNDTTFWGARDPRSANIYREYGREGYTSAISSSPVSAITCSWLVREEALLRRSEVRPCCAPPEYAAPLTAACAASAGTCDAGKAKALKAFPPRTHASGSQAFGGCGASSNMMSLSKRNISPSASPSQLVGGLSMPRVGHPVELFPCSYEAD